MRPNAIVGELDGLRALARSLVHGDADADDLVQDTAIALLEHPPDLDRPVRPWLAAVLRNRWRGEYRASSRRRARELAVAPTELVEANDPIDRARMLERLAAALVALDEPFRATVIRRYLDGRTAAEIARELGVPAGTVRWRLKEGLDRLRAELDTAAPGRWRAVLVAPAGAWPSSAAPIAKGVLVVKLKLAALAAIVLVGVLAYIIHRRAPRATTTQRAVATPAARAADKPSAPRPVEPLPGQARATVATIALPGGAVAGRVVNWSSGEGIDGAELTFLGDAGASTVRSARDGNFELAPSGPGRFVLTTASAPGFLPYAPELMHSNVVVATQRDRAVRGITVFLYPALDYHGMVVDGAGTPVAGARVKLLGTPQGEQVLDRLATEWTSDVKGQFTFHAADDAVLEAVHGRARGWSRLDGNVAITKQLVIRIGEVPARDATIDGRIVDDEGHPVADVLVRALPGDADRDDGARAPAFATTGPDGAFTLGGLDRGGYDVSAEADGYAPAVSRGIAGGTHGIELALGVGEELAGSVVTSAGAAVPSYTLIAFRRDGARREIALARSIVDPAGRFAVHLPRGSYELQASASGWAPSPMVTAAAPAHDLRLAVSEGATVRGVVVSSADGRGIAYARVMREAVGGGASAQPANAGTVTRADGSFELTGVPAGSVSLTFDADGFHPKIEAGLTAHEGDTLGPLAIELAQLVAGETPKTELVGIGVGLSAEADAVRVNMVVPDSGAAVAGIVVGDRIVAVDGAAVTELGLDGTVAKIRGVEGTTVTVSLRHGDHVAEIAVMRRKIRA